MSSEYKGPWDYRIRRLIDALDKTHDGKAQQMIVEKILHIDSRDGYTIPANQQERQDPLNTTLQEAVQWWQNQVSFKAGESTPKEVHDYRDALLTRWEYWRAEKNV